MKYNLQDFANRLEKMNVSLSDSQMEQFVKYYELLIEKNKVMNLTSITDFDEVILKHFVDSLSCVKAVNMNGVKSVIDVGTGAGFPGIPIKIVFPQISVTLMDSLSKRVGFLTEVIEALDLRDISAVHGRAEEMGQDPQYRERYDMCVSRAVSNLAVLSEYCLPFVEENGVFVSYKAGEIQDEVKGAEHPIALLGGRVESITSFDLPDSEIKRTLLVIKKTGKTPEKYPRKPGMPAKKPLT
ncbi:16S rRNA (guanine(527)-N(7))-methyltransferase RsmG [Parasporobacterium paucivorans]|uniref:Ribosomal RNA small subunit methyltransferase G n=1 Tax=Parasporobacterium paucivorans DSM 15970 TaxID=1122934 RepID=A0A1M6B9W2_9FIRM|nr:16S rRNA (guanine(527)-N(7))-methyltransferase RsmG [Parasporobacterium paucivorans]SHI45253.1 16S rRNA (guanine527-N7)-methyltransferase [Parasporobacterium paucivorans DSM 15970]